MVEAETRISPVPEPLLEDVHADVAPARLYLDSGARTFPHPGDRIDMISWPERHIPCDEPRCQVAAKVEFLPSHPEGPRFLEK